MNASCNIIASSTLSRPYKTITPSSRKSATSYRNWNPSNLHSIMLKVIKTRTNTEIIHSPCQNNWTLTAIHAPLTYPSHQLTLIFSTSADFNWLPAPANTWISVHPVFTTHRHDVATNQTYSEYLSGKFSGITQPAQDIHWHLFWHSIKWFKSTDQHTLVKFIHKWLPLLDHHHTQCVSQDNCCPSCHQATETIAHFLECQHAAHLQVWKDLHEKKWTSVLSVIPSATCHHATAKTHTEIIRKKVRGVRVGSCRIVMAAVGVLGGGNWQISLVLWLCCCSLAVM